LISPIFETGAYFSEKWVKVILDDGWTQTYSRLSQIMKYRWSILEGYSKVTTARLLEARRLVASPHLRKSEVPATVPPLLVSVRRKPVKNFADELLKIIPLNAREFLCVDEDKEGPHNDSEFVVEVFNKIEALYEINKDFDFNEKPDGQDIIQSPLVFKNMFSPLLDNPEESEQKIRELGPLLRKTQLTKEELAARETALRQLVQLSMPSAAGSVAQRRRANRPPPGSSRKTGKG
jgi:hypothetical protein